MFEVFIYNNVPHEHFFFSLSASLAEISLSELSLIGNSLSLIFFLFLYVLTVFYDKLFDTIKIA